MSNIDKDLNPKLLNKFHYLNINHSRFYLLSKNKALYNILTFIKVKNLY